MSPHLYDTWVQAALRLRTEGANAASGATEGASGGWFGSGKESESATEHDLMVVEVVEEARPQLRNESHARGYTNLGFEVGPPPPSPSLDPEEGLEVAPTVILESNEECAVPKLTSLRRKQHPPPRHTTPRQTTPHRTAPRHTTLHLIGLHTTHDSRPTAASALCCALAVVSLCQSTGALVRGSAAVILPGQGMCARAAAAAAVSLGRGFGPLVASFKEYEDRAVSLATTPDGGDGDAKRQVAAAGDEGKQEEETRKHAGAWGAPPPRWGGIGTVAGEGTDAAAPGGRAMERWAAEASALILTGGAVPVD